MDSYFRFYKERFIAGMIVWIILMLIYTIKEVLTCGVQFIQEFLQIIR